MANSAPSGEDDGSRADNAPMGTPEAGLGASESPSSSLDDSSHPPGVDVPGVAASGDPAPSTIAANEAEAPDVTRLHSSVSAAVAHWSRLVVVAADAAPML